jgi:hypothetical protein
MNLLFYAFLRTGLLLGADFAGFIGSPQQTNWHDSHPQGSSTKTTRPHSPHSYFSPFFFAKKITYLKVSYAWRSLTRIIHLPQSNINAY